MGAATHVAREGKICAVVEWGVVPYATAADGQRALVASRKARQVPDLLVLCEHPHVITLGRNARREHLRLAEGELIARGVAVHATNRGGDVTYHGPGQLVGYPIFDLGGLRKDVAWYVRSLEEVLIRVAADFGISANRMPATQARTEASGKPCYTGLWVGEEKLAAIGVHISRWVTSHGFAFNVTTDLSYFDLIVPCGIPDKRPTSLARLLGPGRARMQEVKRSVAQHFGEVFERTMEPVDPEESFVGLAHEKAAS